MLQLNERPYNLLWIFAILLFVAGLSATNTTIDIHLHDTYYVLPMEHFIWMPTVLLILSWLLYVVTNKMLFSRTLSWIHILLTILTTLLILAIPYYLTGYEGLAGMPRRYSEDGPTMLLNATRSRAIVFDVLAIVLTAGQLIYVSNLLIGVYKRVKK